MAAMSAAAGRSLNWNVIQIHAEADYMAGVATKLDASDMARTEGGRVVGLCLPEPMAMRLSFETVPI